MATTHQVTMKMQGNSGVGADAKVIRGPQSWAFIYMALGFTVAIELTMISLLSERPWNAMLCAGAVAFTVYLFVFNGWFQNKLLGIKQWCEGKAR
jgi:hypothetical protein